MDTYPPLFALGTSTATTSIGPQLIGLIWPLRILGMIDPTVCLVLVHGVNEKGITYLSAPESTSVPSALVEGIRKKTALSPIVTAKLTRPVMLLLTTSYIVLLYAAPKYVLAQLGFRPYKGVMSQAGFAWMTKPHVYKL
jgi:hypothetical protein